MPSQPNTTKVDVNNNFSLLALVSDKRDVRPVETIEEKKRRRQQVIVETLRRHLGSMSLADAAAFVQQQTGLKITGEALRGVMKLGRNAGSQFVDIVEALEGKPLDQIEIKPVGRFTVRDERTPELTAAFAALRASGTDEVAIEAIRDKLPEFRAGRGWTPEEIAVAIDRVMGKSKKSAREAGSVATEFDDLPEPPESGPKKRGKKK